MVVDRVIRRLQRTRQQLPQLAVERLRVSPAWVGYRWLEPDSARAYLARLDGTAMAAGASYRRIHAEEVKRNPLPRNVMIRDLLPNRVGWWGYSFWDVPERTAGETFVATLPGCRVLHYTDPAKDDQFYPAIVSADQRDLKLREIRFMPPHAARMKGVRRQRLPRAVWFLERVYHNYSHWLTAHLPKLLLLKREGLLDGLVLPSKTNPVIEESLRMLGIDRSHFVTLDPDAVLEADQLTIVGTDRFRPELQQSVRQAFGRLSPDPTRRVFISRDKAPRRRLINEAAIWPLLREAGFEKVYMEDLSFQEQVRMMGETRILFAPHGAGLTNMMFCPPGTHVVEIADLSFPNPNFYATACAMQHHYWLLSGRPVGEAHPLQRDMEAVPGEVEALLPLLLASL